MLFTRRKIILTAAIAAVSLFALIAKFGAYAAPQGAANKLEGAWVTRAVTPGFAQWSFTFSPDPSGRSAGIHGSADVGFASPTPPPPDVSTSPILGEIVMTGPNTAAFNTIWYFVQKGNPNRIVQIGTNVGTVRFITLSKAEESDHFRFYLPSADADGDGFPDPGSTPIADFNVSSVSTQVPFP